MNKQQKGSKAMFTIDLKIKKKIIKLVVLENDEIGDLGTKLFNLAGIGAKEEGSYLKKLEEELRKIYEQGEVSENIKKKIYKVLDYGKIKVEEGDISKETETPFRILQDSLMMAQEQQHRSNNKKRQFNYDIVQIVQPKISYQRSQRQIKIQDHNLGAMNYAQNNNNRHHHQTNRSRQRVNYQYDIKPPSSYLNQPPPSHQPIPQKDQHKPVLPLPLPVQNQLSTNHNNLQNNLSYHNYHSEQGELNKDSLTRKYEQLDKRCDEYIIKNIKTQKPQSSKPLHNLNLNHNHNPHQNNNNHNHYIVLQNHNNTNNNNRIQQLNNNQLNTNYNYNYNYNYNRVESINNHINNNYGHNFKNNGNVSNNYTKALNYQRNNGNNNRQYVSYRNNENNYNVLLQKEKENRSKSKDEYSNIDHKFGQLDLTSKLNLRNNYNQKGEGRQIIKNQSQNALVYNNNNNKYLEKPLQTKNQNLSSSYSQIYLKWPQHYTQMNSNTQKTQQIETTKPTQRPPNILNIKTNIPKEQFFSKSPIKSNIYASPYNMLNDANEPQSKKYYFLNGNDDGVKVNEYDFKRKGTRKYNYLSDQ